MGLLPVLQPHLVHFHDYRSPTADFVRSAACAAQRMYTRAGVGAPDPPQNSSFRVSAGALGTVGPGWNDFGARLGRLVNALAHRLACTLESERRWDERHCGRARPGWWSSGLERRTKARIPAGYASSALLGRVLCSAACALARVVSLSTHVALRICMRTEIPRASSADSTWSSFVPRQRHIGSLTPRRFAGARGWRWAVAA